MSAISASGSASAGDKFSVGDYDGDRIQSKQDTNGAEQQTPAQQPLDKSPGDKANRSGPLERRRLLQFTADYRRFRLDNSLLRRQLTQPAVAGVTGSGIAAQPQPNLTRGELEARAERLFNRFQNDGFLGLSPTTPYADIRAELEGLTAQDAKQLREIYQQKYSAQRNGRDLLRDISVEVTELPDRLRAFQILAPERIHPLTEALPPNSNRTGISADPRLDELVSGSNVKYTFNQGPTIAPPDYRGPFVRYLVQGENGQVETRTGYAFDAHFEKPGVYRVTFEVTDKGQPPEYYTLKQVVRDPAEKARESLLSMPGTTVDPELYLHGIDAQIGVVEQQLAEAKGQLATLEQQGWLNTPQYQLTRLHDRIRELDDVLGQLQQIKQEVPGKLFGGATGKPLPLQAVLIATERPQPVPLQLYAKPLGNNRWAIVDLTSPTNARVFEGQAGATSEEGLRSAWREFIGANNLPAGQIAALPPSGLNFPAQEVWNDQSAGRSGFQQWATNLGWGSLALAAAGVVAAIVPGLEEFAPPLFIAAGMAGVGSGGLNTYDRLRYGNFRWNSAETALDLLSIVGGLTGTAGGAAALLRGVPVVAETAEGASLTLRNLGGKFTAITQGIDKGSAIASGIIIGNVWLEQIDRINRSNLTPEEKQKQVGDVLHQAAMMGGILVIGHGVSRFSPLVAEELNTLLRPARFEPELEQWVRDTPGLQRALREQGPDRLRQLYDDYKAGGRNRSSELQVGSFQEYVASNGVPTRTTRIPQSLTEALGVSAESLQRMSARELNEAVVARTNPELLAALRRRDLPSGAQSALNDALAQDYKLATAPNFDRARQTLSETINARLGESVNSLAELRQVLSYFEGPRYNSSRGSIGNSFYRTHLAEGAQTREVTVPRNLYVTDPLRVPDVQVRRPDYLLINGRRTLDIKTGYADGAIDLKQLKDYNDLVNASQRRRNVELRQLLAENGVQGGLTGHDYLFLPGAGTSAEDAARRAFGKIETELQGRTQNIRVYYLGDDGNIYKLVKGPTGQLGPELIGTKVPN